MISEEQVQTVLPKEHKSLSNLASRVLVAVVAIPLILWIVMLGGWFFFVFVEIIAGVALMEFYALAERKGAYPNKILGLIFGILICFTFIHERLEFDLLSVFGLVGKPEVHYPSQFAVFLSIVLLSVFCILAGELERTKSNALFNTAVTVFGVFYISAFLGSFIGIRELFGTTFPTYRYAIDLSGPLTKMQIVDRWGAYLVISILATIWVCDSAAYFVGRAIGRHKLALRISPNKTWEGAIGGFVFSIITMAVAKTYFLPFMAMRDAMVIGVIVGIFGQLGDLAESLLKRDAGAKDSSTIIPGHGGAFDRFDSLLFVAPLVYLYVFIVIAT
ncbi:MAG TPA: phosphatidate cytidylyltransferase [Candidatus Kapabacteria bacterium]|nr:phosphatidate cytidylyltransferase [Candidatus Kapabacteria bacterium]